MFQEIKKNNNHNKIQPCSEAAAWVSSKKWNRAGEEGCVLVWMAAGTDLPRALHKHLLHGAEHHLCSPPAAPLLRAVMASAGNNRLSACLHQH